MRHIVFSIFLFALMGSPAIARDQSSRSREFYHIFDFQTDSKRSSVITGATAGFAINVSQSDTMTPIVLDEPPETPRRFTIVNPLENSRMGGMIAMIPPAQLAQFKQASCDGAVWIANAARKLKGSQQLRLTLCLFPYQAGYQLNIYGIDSEARGGGLSDRLGRVIAGAVVGSPEDWTNKTIIDVIRSIQSETGVKATYVEGQPEFVGTPWLEPSYALPTSERTAKD